MALSCHATAPKVPCVLSNWKARTLEGSKLTFANPAACSAALELANFLPDGIDEQRCCASAHASFPRS